MLGHCTLIKSCGFKQFCGATHGLLVIWCSHASRNNFFSFRILERSAFQSMFQLRFFYHVNVTFGSILYYGDWLTFVMTMIRTAKIYKECIRNKLTNEYLHSMLTKDDQKRAENGSKKTVMRILNNLHDISNLWLTKT